MNLEQKIDKERKRVKILRILFENAVKLIPEKQEEYNMLKACYSSVGDEYVNSMRIMMGNLTNPSVDDNIKQHYAKLIPEILDISESNGKNVEYLRKSYELIMEAYKNERM